MSLLKSVLHKLRRLGEPVIAVCPFFKMGFYWKVFTHWYGGSMILRKRGGQWESISQHAHSWLSGQMGRQWLPHDLLASPLSEEFLLAVSEHDIGYLPYETEPVLDPATRRPFDFLEMPSELRIHYWEWGIRHLASTSPYAALLVSRHSCSICHSKVSLDGKVHELTEPIRRFLHDQQRHQAFLVDHLKSDGRYTEAVETPRLEAASHFLRTLDLLSLYLAMDKEGPIILAQAPMEGAAVDVCFRKENDACYRLDPWPFRTASFSGTLPARHLLDGYESEAHLRSHFAESPPMTWQFELRPG